MFKKERDLSERSKTLLKNKEVRSLKTEIVKQFPNVQEEELNNVIPNKADITLTKLANKTLLYSIEGITLFFDVNGRNNLYPTLPFLWRFPHALPTFVIYSPVSEFVLRGADLMTPGLCTSMLPTLSKLGLKEGGKACVRIVGNPLPFAVGDSLIDTNILSDGLRHKGKALTVHHVYGDLISGSGVVPNSGFGPSRIYPIETEGAIAESEQHDFDSEGDSESDNDQDIGNDNNNDNNNDNSNDHKRDDNNDNESTDGKTLPDEQSADLLGEDLAATHLTATDQLEEDDDASLTGLNSDNIDVESEPEEESGEPEEESESQDPALDPTVDPAVALQARLETQQTQDAMLLQMVLLATKYVIKDKQLPMLVSTYWSILQRCAAASGSKIDLKASSYRKVSSFLSHCQSVDLLLLTEEHGVSTIVRLNKTHDSFRGVKVDNPEAFKTAVLTSANPTAGVDSGTNGAVSEFALFQAAHSNTGVQNKKVQVLELFKLTKPLKDIFGVPRGEYGEYLKPAEVRDILVMYIKTHNLENEADRSSLLIPPAEAMHKILASYSSANTTKSASMAVTKSTAGAAGASAGAGAGTGTNGTSAHVSAGGNAYDSMDYEDSDYIDPLDDDYPGSAPTSAFNSGMFSTIPLPGSSAGSEIKMKVHQGGLKQLDSSTMPRPISSTDYPSLGTTTTTTATAKPATYGVGGWGVDKGTTWKPVSLSTARATTTANTGTATATGSARPTGRSSNDAEFPTLGSAHASGNHKKPTAGTLGSIGGTKAKSVVYSELPTDLVLRKEDVFKAVMKKMSPYFAVISQTGGMTVHSGQIPKARILVETRMGNKAVTILRGLEVFAIDLAALTKECQKKFACSVALSSVPGIPKDKEIVIQGNLAYEVEAYLSTNKGIPKSLIEIDAAKGAKLKKKK